MRFCFIKDLSMRAILTGLIIAAALLVLCACGSGTEEPGEQGTGQEEAGTENSAAGITITQHPAYEAENEPEEEINCWGDSITEGYGSDGLTYPDVLEELTGIPARNLGVGGESSREILARSLIYGSQKEDILVIQMGDNGGWKDLDELIRQYRLMIERAGTDRYIIISSTDDPDDFEQIWGYTTKPVGMENTWYEEKYEEAFGEHLFNGRKYLILHGLEINGLWMTEADHLRAQKGNISLQLRNPWIDNTHLNEAGYIALAHGIYEKGKELGYW